MKLGRELNITQKSARHLGHRLRAGFARTDGLFASPVEVDEVYAGGKERNNHTRKKLQDLQQDLRARLCCGESASVWYSASSQDSWDLNPCAFRRATLALPFMASTALDETIRRLRNTLSTSDRRLHSVLANPLRVRERPAAQESGPLRARSSCGRGCRAPPSDRSPPGSDRFARIRRRPFAVLAQQRGGQQQFAHDRGQRHLRRLAGLDQALVEGGQARIAASAACGSVRRGCICGPAKCRSGA